jgi:hypothetical protein
MASITTPDNILRQTIVPNTPLKPAAKVISQYQSDTRRDVAEPPQTNELIQLGNALASLQPGLRQAGAAIVEDKKERDLSAGEIKGQELAQQKNIRDLGQAVSEGQLDAGASPAYIFATKANFLKLRAEQGQMQMRNDYYANGDLRNSDDPNAYTKWASEWKQNFDKSHLQDSEGNPLYTGLETSKSKFHEGLNHAFVSLQSEHIAHRVAERGRLGEETASNLVTTRLDSDLGVGDNLLPKDQRKLQLIADTMVDGYYNPITGAVANGMDKSKANHAMTDVLMTKAASEGDASILDIAKYIKTPGGSLADTHYFKDKADDISLKIASNEYAKIIRKETIGKMEVEGTFDDRMGTYKKQFEYTQHEFQKKLYVEAGTAKALSYNNLNHMNPKQLQEQSETINELRKFDPKSAMELENHITYAREHAKDAENKDRFPLAEMGLYNMMLRAPGSPATNRTIDQWLTDKRIGGDEWRRLRSESDRMGQAHLKYAHLLDDKFYTTLEASVHNGVAKDLSKISGAESVAGGEAAFRFRMLAVAIADKTPGITPAELAIALQPNVKAIVGEYNETAKEEFDTWDNLARGRKAVAEEALHAAKPEVIKQTAEQVKKAEAQTEQIKAQDAGKIAPIKKFDPTMETKYQKFKQKYPLVDDAELRQMFRAGTSATTK